MTPEQFCYWMQGFVELSGGFPPTAEQWHSISEHLQTVFNKKTPPVSAPTINPARVPPQVDPTTVKPYDGYRQGDWPFKPSDIIC